MEGGLRHRQEILHQAIDNLLITEFSDGGGVIKVAGDHRTLHGLIPPERLLHFMLQLIQHEERGSSSLQCTEPREHIRGVGDRNGAIQPQTHRHHIDRIEVAGPHQLWGERRALRRVGHQRPHPLGTYGQHHGIDVVDDTTTSSCYRSGLD